MSRELRSLWFPFPAQLGGDFFRAPVNYQLSYYISKVQQLDGDSYTEFTGANFDCGRNKRLCEVQGTSCDEKERRREDRNNDIGVIDQRQEGKPIKVFTSADVVVENAYCGATIISDRWAVSTAHCYDDQPYSDKKRTLRIRVGTFFEESVEVRNVYKHPGYTTGRLYNDLAVLELGRRIEYDFERSHHLPTLWNILSFRHILRKIANDLFFFWQVWRQSNLY